MSDEEIELTERDYFILGMFVERPRAYKRYLRRDSEQIERLVRGGYLEWKRRIAFYAVTPKGHAAWKAYRFTS